MRFCRAPCVCVREPPPAPRAPAFSCGSRPRAALTPARRRAHAPPGFLPMPRCPLPIAQCARSAGLGRKEAQGKRKRKRKLLSSQFSVLSGRVLSSCGARPRAALTPARRRAHTPPGPLPMPIVHCALIAHCASTSHFSVFSVLLRCCTTYNGMPL
jgi:hypothetical protein